MPDLKRGDETLPSLREFAADYQPVVHYYLTIVFHPDSSRIGEWAELDLAGQDSGLVGRNTPCFSSGRALDDPYVSRRALQFNPVEGGLVLRRPQQASRCSVAGRELLGTHSLDDAALDAGVALTLSHAVVLLLRRSEIKPPTGEVPHCGLVGSSVAMQHLRAGIARAANCDHDVLLRGETGTGKELVAAAIHRFSRRAQGPFVAVNMAAIPPSLAAASLFGSARGAFTGAAKAQAGYFQQAAGGTLFLDEVGDTPVEVQPLLLRALQEREIQCVGGVVKRVDLRIVSATDVPIDTAGSNFRSALRHRLGTVELVLPALRERPEDIGELLLHFIREAAAREGLGDSVFSACRDNLQVSVAWARIFRAFLGYHWPGNVRQLVNYATQTVLASVASPTLPAGIREVFAAPATAPAPVPADIPVNGPLARLGAVSEDEFREVMIHCRFEVAAVAEALGVSRQSVYRRIHSSQEFRLVAQVGDDELRAELARNGGDIHAVAMHLAVSESALRARLRSAGQPV
ncbi:sigma 54-interacting transcriptional regulator [Haliea sp. E17]|uniref:sigma 54-interacting transcriptional regulator n=1 Tax=Haliea sp. E17 TaxID=3401576 RepID=UPI003AAD6190